MPLGEAQTADERGPFGLSSADVISAKYQQWKNYSTAHLCMQGRKHSSQEFPRVGVAMVSHT